MISQRWPNASAVIEAEHGHPRAELRLVLRALGASGFGLDARDEQIPRRHQRHRDKSQNQKERPCLIRSVGYPRPVD
ncbi:hypothetical protein NLM33_37065 [Bradyrhizobium sp. CCGUVB1N3]|uniref:hypothetical protein n=1 Tax=Bradyrhizobium sp. CCGUVB1N3 TaxID=2949629 RepID=UPI0020B3926F|nr:hypothetical protein [Bradyrhizobium sp. CCGUVB1N3]MCP3475860.1 hypothetical protein [Bradyrhizobium sp. CCGUVB1N3]